MSSTSITPPSSARQLGWFDLPVELRNMVYRYLLETNKDVSFRPCADKDHVPTGYMAALMKRHNLSAQILRCSKAIYHEALPILYSNRVRFKVEDMATLRRNKMILHSIRHISLWVDTFVPNPICPWVLAGHMLSCRDLPSLPSLRSPSPGC
jgi:hypothetical protein